MKHRYVFFPRPQPSIPLSTFVAILIEDRSEFAHSGQRANAIHPQLPDGKRIRIAYMGKMLKENQSLEAQGWQPGHVVNALVFNRA